MIKKLITLYVRHCEHIWKAAAGEERVKLIAIPDYVALRLMLKITSRLPPYLSEDFHVENGVTFFRIMREELEKGSGLKDVWAKPVTHSVSFTVDSMIDRDEQPAQTH